ncbi:uncharacterized protein C1orf232 [Denticeps clupeoides]|uniref:Testis development-related protein n=1 Tax=Denticeps clupeoides TaxID=299321 RepID=A0AAY4AAY4_9TELE|nr:uncharacterized protein C1orf232 homolog [Denticeps clupeoides]
MTPLWKVYKSKVMKTLNPDMEEDAAEEAEAEAEVDMTPDQGEEGPNAVSQLAKKMQGAGAKGWKSMTALFNKDDEHQLLESETESQPVADHPLAVRPEEPRPTKRNAAFWDSFATKWQQTKQAQAAAAAAVASEAESDAGQEVGNVNGGRSLEVENQEGGEGSGVEGGGGGFSKYASLGGGSEEASFKWNFVTSKLAELKTKSMAKTN